MILVDSSVWIDHFRHDDPALSALLNKRQALTHPFVTGEMALGSLRQRDVVLDALRGLLSAQVATDKEVQAFIDHHKLFWHRHRLCRCPFVGGNAVVGRCKALDPRQAFAQCSLAPWSGCRPRQIKGLFARR